MFTWAKGLHADATKRVAAAGQEGEERDEASVDACAQMLTTGIGTDHQTRCSASALPQARGKLSYPSGAGLV
jgi:hypothetical protein